MNIHWRLRSWPSPALIEAYKLIPLNAAILDIGCIGYHQMHIANHLGLTGARHYGVDWGDAENIPQGFTYRKADLNKTSLPFDDDQFDFVVVSHTIEHLDNPVEFFSDCVRVCKPGGILYFEAPSERSACVPSSNANPDFFYSLSFFDDPTHKRPWPPQAFYRLARLNSCEPLHTGRLFSWIHRLVAPLSIPFCWLTGHKLLEACVWQTVGWSSYLIAKKPANIKGRAPFNYYIPGRAYAIKVKPLYPPKNA
jgi:ubiquinone/menaquinone biosynthesis C-methylase UbiE